MRGVDLPVGHEFVAELVHRPAVHAHDGRVAPARHVVQRLDQQRVDRGAVGAVEVQGFGGREALVAQPGVVVGERAQAAVVQRGEVVRVQVVAAQHYDAAVGGDIEIDVETVAVGQRGRPCRWRRRCARGG